MKKTPVFYFKTASAILGFILIAFSFFAEFQSTCGFVERYSDIVPISVPGSKSKIWYLFSLGSITIFSVGYFVNEILNLILVLVFSIILVVLIPFFTWISEAGLGGPCGHSIEYGYYITLTGSLLVFTATIISIINGQNNDESSTNS